MSSQLVEPTSTPQRDVEQQHSKGSASGGRSFLVLAAALAGSWLVPVLASLLHADWLLIPLFVLAIASVVRTGGGLLDRLVISGFLLSGALLALGLVASLWPWGLQPLPASGVLLSVICGCAWFGKRRPRIPLRVRGTDAIILCTGAFVWHYLWAPMAGKSSVDRLRLVMTIEDRLTHLSIVDTIHRVGGYAFLHQSQARITVSPPTESVYPEGSHFLISWLDIFFRSTTGIGPMADFPSRYFIYVLAAFTLLCMAAVWAVRWAAGPRLAGWRAAAVCSAVAAVMVAGPLVLTVPNGFDSETVGLLFLVVAVALLVRPAMGLVEYALISGAGFVTVGYCYNVFAVYVAVALLAGLFVYRRRHRGHRVVLYTSLALGLGVAVVPSVITVLSTFNIQNQVAAPGLVLPLPRSLFIGVVLLVVVAALVSGNWRLGSVQAYLATLAGTLGIVVLFGAYQWYTLGRLSYYFEKMAVAGFVIGLIGLGEVIALLRPMSRPRSTGRIPRRLVEPLVACGVTLSFLSLMAGLQWGLPSTHTQTSAWHKTPLAVWARGGLAGDLGPATKAFVTRDLSRVSSPVPVPVIPLYTDNGAWNWRMTFFAQTMLHNDGIAAQFNEVGDVYMGASMPKRTVEYDVYLNRLKTVVARQKTPPIILVANQKLADRLRVDLASLQDGRVTVLYSPLGH